LIDGYGNDPDRIAFLLISHTHNLKSYTPCLLVILTLRSLSPPSGNFNFRLQTLKFAPSSSTLKLEKKTSEREIILGPENEPANEPKIVAPR